MSTAKKVAFYTLGCKLNFSESSAIARQFGNLGYERIEFGDAADIYVVNTCSVTENADQKCRNIIRQALRKSPDARVVVIGCYAQLQPQEIAAIPGVDLVLGASEKFNVSNYVNELEEKRQEDQQALVYASEISHADFFVDAYSFGDRTRTFLKVQDGCDYKCTFCTIPLARGKSRSNTIENTLKQAEEIASAGTKEVVLTGVNIGDFGKGENSHNRKSEDFLQLVQALDDVEGIERFRISSIEPNLLKNEIIEFVASSKRFMPHFHMPLQSGSDEILTKMKRRYRSNLYRERVEKIKSLIPDCCIGVDVIVGFPGETEEEFIKTYSFLNELPISYLHVFTYSERENTEAIFMDGVVPVQERKRRTNMLRNLSAKKLRDFYNQNIHKTYPVLFETEAKGEKMHGYTSNYIKVEIPYDEEMVNKVQDVELTDLTSEGFVACYLRNDNFDARTQIKSVSTGI